LALRSLTRRRAQSATPVLDHSCRRSGRHVVPIPFHISGSLFSAAPRTKRRVGLSSRWRRRCAVSPSGYCPSLWPQGVSVHRCLRVFVST
jgi:hypothetical protein